MVNIKTWTGLPVEESIRMTEDRDKWRKYVHSVANPQIEDSERTEHCKAVHTSKAVMTYGFDFGSCSVTMAFGAI